MGKFTTSLIIALALVLLAGTVSADMLEISEVTVEVDGDKQSADENGGNIDIKPMSKLELKITIDNLFDRDTENAEIEDVQVEAVLEEIDDGDDIDEEADEFDLRAGRDKTVTLTFNIPLLLETDETFTLTLTAEGDDQNNTRHYDEVIFDVDVDKENHEIRFTRKELLPSTLTCEGDSDIVFDLLNTGQEDEEVELTVSAPNLGYTETLEFDMVEDIDDDDNFYEFRDSINVEKGKTGTFPVGIRVEYNRGRDVLEETLYLKVEACDSPKPVPTPTPTPTPTPKPTPEPEEEQVTVVTQPSVSAPYVRPSSTAVATPRTSYSDSWWDKNKWVVLIIIADVLLLAIGIAVVLAILKKRK